MKFVILVLVIAVALYVLHRSRQWSKPARAAGPYPPPGQGTDADVERFVRHGRKMTAIKLYREIHDVDLTTAKAAVDRMVAEADDR